MAKKREYEASVREMADAFEVVWDLMHQSVKNFRDTIEAVELDTYIDDEWNINGAKVEEDGLKPFQIHQLSSFAMLGTIHSELHKIIEGENVQSLGLPRSEGETTKEHHEFLGGDPTIEVVELKGNLSEVSKAVDDLLKAIKKGKK